MERQYYITDYASISASGTRRIMFITPEQRRDMYAEIVVQSSGVCKVDLYEGSDKTAGTTITAFSSDRVHTPTPLTTCSYTPTGGTTDGTLIASAVASAGMAARIATAAQNATTWLETSSGTSWCARTYRRC